MPLPLVSKNRGIRGVIAMGLYQSQEVYPTLDETVDATSSAVSFTVKIRGTQCVKYTIYIYDIATNTQKYTDTQTLASTLYDGDTLSISVDMLALGADSYYWYADLYYDSTNYITTYYYTFVASTPPSCVFSPTVPTTITTPSYEFICAYTQAEGVAVKNFTMTLYDSTGITVIATSDENTSSPNNIRYTFNGLISGQSYKVQCTGVTQGNVAFSTALTSFAVSYVTPVSLAQPTAVLNDDTSVTVSWPNIVLITGTTSGTTSYAANFLYTGNYGLLLAAGAYVQFALDFTAPFTVHWVVKFPAAYTGVFGEVKDTSGANYINFGYSGTRFYLNINGDYYYDANETLTTNPYIVAIVHDGITISLYAREVA